MAETNKPSTKRITYAYRQSSAYRTVAARGAYGGLTSSGEIFMSVYSERPHVPDLSHLDINDDAGTFTEVLKTTPGLVREVEVGLLMDLATARAYRAWIDEKIKEIEGAKRIPISKAL